MPWSSCVRTLGFVSEHDHPRESRAFERDLNHVLARFSVMVTLGSRDPLVLRQGLVRYRRAEWRTCRQVLVALGSDRLGRPVVTDLLLATFPDLFSSFLDHVVVSCSCVCPSPCSGDCHGPVHVPLSFVPCHGHVPFIAMSFMFYLRVLVLVHVPCSFVLFM